jgi:para-nitrobenzyl esterase
MFDHLDQEPWRQSTGDRKLADAMSSYWVNFAKSGNPNGAGLPRWPEFTSTHNSVLYLNDPTSTNGVPNLNSLEVFDTVYAQIRSSRFGSR